MKEKPMTIVERVARVLAGEHYSRNAEGHAPEGASVSDIVDTRWREYLGEAVAVLKTIREPDEHMVAAAAGQTSPAAIWQAMARAAAGETAGS
jgi:hypothetical protein